MNITFSDINREICLNLEYPDLLSFSLSNKQIFEDCKSLLPYKHQIFQIFSEPNESHFFKLWLEANEQNLDYNFLLIRDWALSHYMSRVDIEQFISSVHEMLVKIFNLYSIDSNFIIPPDEIYRTSVADSLHLTELFDREYYIYNNEGYIYVNDLNEVIPGIQILFLTREFYRKLMLGAFDNKYLPHRKDNELESGFFTEALNKNFRELLTRNIYKNVYIEENISEDIEQYNRENFWDSY